MQKTVMQMSHVKEQWLQVQGTLAVVSLCAFWTLQYMYVV